MDIGELKIKAYDIMAQIEYLRDELNRTNQEIAKRTMAEEQKEQKEQKK